VCVHGAPTEVSFESGERAPLPVVGADEDQTASEGQ
jgi:hypothetical protein